MEYWTFRSDLALEDGLLLKDEERRKKKKEVFQAITLVTKVTISESCYLGNHCVGQQSHMILGVYGCFSFYYTNM